MPTTAAIARERGERMSGMRGLRRPQLVSQPQSAIEVEIATRRPRLELKTEAHKDSLPLMRQALRALGQAIGADPDPLRDAELALTEACSNAVRHAYRDGRGTIAVRIEARASELLATVRDRGRGMRHVPPRPRRPRRGPGGLGLRVIGALARDVEIRSEPGTGTEVVMALPIDRDWPRSEPASVGGSIAEVVLRRMLAMAAAQSDYTAERVSDMLVVAEVVARHAPGHVTGSCLNAQLARGREGIELRLGPFRTGAARLVLDETEAPMIGSVVERIADDVQTVTLGDGAERDGEELVLLFGPG